MNTATERRSKRVCPECGKSFAASSHSAIAYHRDVAHNAFGGQMKARHVRQTRDREKRHRTAVSRLKKMRKLLLPRGRKKNFDSTGALLILAEAKWRTKGVAA